jgi:hypothetical protein
MLLYFTHELRLKCELEECLDVYFGPCDVDQTINLTVMTISDALYIPFRQQDVSNHTKGLLQAHVASSISSKFFLLSKVEIRLTCWH